MLFNSGVGESGASRGSTGGEFGGDGWVRSGNVMPLSRGISAGVVSAPMISIGLSSWVWVKIYLVVGNSSSAVLMS